MEYLAIIRGLTGVIGGWLFAFFSPFFVIFIISGFYNISQKKKFQDTFGFYEKYPKISIFSIFACSIIGLYFIYHDITNHENNEIRSRYYDLLTMNFSNNFDQSEKLKIAGDFDFNKMYFLVLFFSSWVPIYIFSVYLINFICAKYIKDFNSLEESYPKIEIAMRFIAAIPSFIIGIYFFG